MRNDLSPGQQITQAGHAIADFCATEHADVWRAASNSIVVVAVPDERTLRELCERATARTVPYTGFVEPDLCDELTAVAFAPAAATRKLLSSFPLAGKTVAGQDRADMLRKRERDLRNLVDSMRACEQAPGVSVLDHGAAVRHAYLLLVDALEHGTTPPQWRLPVWAHLYARELLDEVGPLRDDICRYLLVHDCGKPRCVTVDDDGKRHFPNHANVSADLWLEHESTLWSRATQAGFAPFIAEAVGVPDTRISRWIRNDMTVHTLRGDDVASFATSPDAAVHLLAGLAEVHANAAMFGGTDSTSFKIKLKHLDRRGRAVCAERYGPRT